jgi:hypothetical protein
VDPWGQPNLEFIGTDGLAFHPNVDSSSDIYVYLDDIQRFGKGEFKETVTHKGMKTYRFVLPYYLLQNADENPANKIYY